MRTHPSTALSLLMAALATGALAADRPGEQRKPTQIADDLGREYRTLDMLKSRLDFVEKQISSIRQAGRGGARQGAASPGKRLAAAPDSVITKTLRVERKLAENDLVYTVQARNTPALFVLESIAKTSARELQLHSDISRKRLADRINLALSNIEMVELVLYHPRLEPIGGQRHRFPVKTTRLDLDAPVTRHKTAQAGN